ncbi:LOW QUALITY PROTEIN: ADP-ribosylation factor family protein [Colletotrichum tofieldiae]|nr:LOW QUALITY PROTEIN: ADP-ribosylation factor family protein [Colletotrichum tofieldiae]
MYHLAKGLYLLATSKEEYSVILLGLDNAGKTTFHEQVKSLFLPGNPDPKLRTVPTVGQNVSTITLPDMYLKIWDVGGQHSLRRLWQSYYASAHAIVFIIDSTDIGNGNLENDSSGRLDECRLVLEDVLQHSETEGVPVLVLANKQDREDCVEVVRIKEGLVKKVFEGEKASSIRDSRVLPVSALTGTGVKEAVEWSEVEQGVEAAGDAVAVSDGSLRGMNFTGGTIRLALMELEGPAGRVIRPRERFSLLQALNLAKRKWLGIIFYNFFSTLFDFFFFFVYASTTLSFSADKSSDMRPPLSLRFPSSASFSSTSVEKSLAFCSATFPQCSSVTASTGVPPSLEIWLISPCLFRLTVTLLLLLDPVRIHKRDLALVAEEAKGHAEGAVQPTQGHGLALGGGEDGEGLALVGGVGLTEVAQGGDDGEAGRVGEVSVVGEDVDVGADGPDLLAGDEAEGLGVEGARAADRLFEDARKEDLGLGRAVDLEGGRGHGAQLGGDLEDALEGAVCVGDRDFC